MEYEFVLGAEDPEMRMIESLLEAHGLKYWFAAAGGSRCHPGNANRADGLISPSGQTAVLASDFSKYYFVESRPGTVSLAEKHGRLRVIDHHEEGDPGYTKQPADFWAASSLGQTVAALSKLGHPVEVTQEMRVVAAMDHCRQAALQGKCPGVTAKEVLARRVKEIARAHRVPEKTVEEKIESYSSILKSRPKFAFAEGRVIDFTDTYLGVGYSLDLLSVQTALDKMGSAALLRHSDTDAPVTEKITLSGHASERMVEHFMRVYALYAGLHRVYGVPARAYAGGYLYA